MAPADTMRLSSDPCCGDDWGAMLAMSGLRTMQWRNESLMMEEFSPYSIEDLIVNIETFELWLFRRSDRWMEERGHHQPELTTRHGSIRNGGWFLISSTKNRISDQSSPHVFLPSHRHPTSQQQLRILIENHIFHAIN
jgi:hypothetical protein